MSSYRNLGPRSPRPASADIAERPVLRFDASTPLGCRPLDYSKYLLLDCTASARFSVCLPYGPRPLSVRRGVQSRQMREKAELPATAESSDDMGSSPGCPL